MEEFDAKLDKPYDKGYVVLPVRFLEEAMQYTQKLTVIPAILETNNEGKTRMKLLLIAIDLLRKDKYKDKPFNTRNIAKLLGVGETEVDAMIKEAMDMKLIKKTTAGYYKISFENSGEPITQKKLSQEQFLTMDVIGQVYTEKFKYHMKNQEPCITKADLFAVKELVGKYDMEQISELLDGYFKLNNDYLKTSGYKLKDFKNNISSILSSMSRTMSPDISDKGSQFIERYKRYYVEFYDEFKQIITNDIVYSIGERVMNLDKDRIDFFAKTAAQETIPDKQKLMLLSSLASSRFAFVWDILEERYNLNHIKEATEKKIKSFNKPESVPTDETKLKKCEVLRREE